MTVSIETATSEYYDAWWDHHATWLRGGFPNSAFEAANARVGSAASALRLVLRIGRIGMLRQPVDISKEQYIQRMIAT